MSAGSATRRSGEQANVRRCVACGTDDLRAALGVAVEFRDTTWRCPYCGATTWVLAMVELPSELPGGGDSCPYVEGPKP